MIGLGDGMALGSALAWASSLLLFSRLKEVGAPALNLFKNVVATALLGLTMLALQIAPDVKRSATDFWLLVGSGVLGLAVADSLFLAGLRRINASIAAVTDCAYSPTVLLLSAYVLHEPMPAGLLGGAALVVVGLFVVSYSSRVPAQRIDKAGVALAVLGVMLTATAAVMAKPALDRSNLIEATTLRLCSGSVALVLFQAARGKLRMSLSLFSPQPLWRFAVPATLLGTYLAMILWLGGIKYGLASRAALLNQSATLFALVISRLAGDEVPPRRWLGAAVAVAGVILVITA